MNKITQILNDIGSSGGTAELYQDLGKAYIEDKQMDMAYSALKKSIEIDAADPWTYLYLGNVLFFQKNYAEAIKWFEKSKALMPDVSVPYWCAAETYEKLNEIETADFFFRKALQLEPNNDTAKRKFDRWLERKNSYAK